MKKSRKIKSVKNKLMLAVCAVAMPLAATSVAYSLCSFDKVNADTSASNYYSSYVEEKSMTNNNFNSSSSTYSLSTSLSGWTGQVPSSNTTAGIINTGTSFQNYMADTYYLSRNPGAKASDKSILMINSKTSQTENVPKRQGYKSSTISLSANSYYSFQVSFKTDSDYVANTTYVERGVVEDEDKTISKSTFESRSFSTDMTPVYVEYRIGSTTYYIQKTLTENPEKLAETVTLATGDVFYEDENYIGFENDGQILYVSTEDAEEESGEITIASGTTTFSCNLTYNPTEEEYEVSPSEKYYSTKTEYTSVDDYIYGSIYLSGLTDKDGNAVKADFTEVTSKDWVTFYFFVATGDTDQSVTLDLWLGANREGYTSGGAVFFDDCHVFQYSENAFWRTYSAYADRNYVQNVSSSNGTTQKVFDCTQIFDLREDSTISFDSHNLDFEAGVLDNGYPVTNWSSPKGTGKARVYDVNAPEAFKSDTGYDFVGSNLSCKVDFENENVSVIKNQYVLGLSANNEYVKVTSNDIPIEANAIYKIKAYYKISELSSGSAYLFVEESDAVLGSYGLTDGDGYTLLASTASSAISSNGEDDFTNNYGTVEFYVKGGALYNSAIKLSLGLGSETENATGCIVFDDITITRASTTDYDNATNKVALGEISASLSVTNGEFNDVTVDEDGNFPLSPNDWTITSNGQFTFGGVINTAQSEYDKYVQAYNDLRESGVSAQENPYYWASYGNATPGNRFGNKTDTDNVLMLANCPTSSNNTWQSLKSPNISLSAGSSSEDSEDSENETDSSTYHKISFWYNTASQIKVTLYDSNGFALFESEKFSSNGSWEEYEIFIKPGFGASEVYLLIELGTENEPTTGFAYFDHFTLDSTITQAEYEEEENKLGNVVDLSNFYLNLPTNNITNEVDTSFAPAYSSTTVAGTDSTGAIISSNKFKEMTDSVFKIEGEEEKDVFFIQTQNTGTHAIQSNFNFDLSNSYYKLSFKLKTNFLGTLDKDKSYNYGVTVGLTGFDYMTGLISNEEYQEYTIYFHPSDATTAQLYISLISDAPETIGAMAIYDLQFVEIESSEYESANSIFTSDGYDVNEDRILISQADPESEDDSDSDNESDSEEEGDTSSPNGSLNWSILISSILMGLAIVIAIVGVALRRVKIKKIERKRKESYDRKSSLEVDAIKIKARAERDAEVQKIKEEVEKFNKELQSLEEKHKEKVIKLRSKDKGEVSKQTDREFKDFARKRTVVAEKIDSLNKQIENIMSPEYLLDLERKIYTQEEAKKRELAKLSKKKETSKTDKSEDAKTTKSDSKKTKNSDTKKKSK